MFKGCEDHDSSNGFPEAKQLVLAAMMLLRKDRETTWGKARASIMLMRKYGRRGLAFVIFNTGIYTRELGVQHECHPPGCDRGI